MGLEMYLRGYRTVSEQNYVLIDGYEVESHRVVLGEWRKHWALHECIEQEYIKVNGEESQRTVRCGKKPSISVESVRIFMEPKFLLEVADAIEQGNLPDANAGHSHSEITAFYKEPEQVAKTAKIFRDAYAWVSKDDAHLREVEYCGSW
tara:strand:+ start:65 stop:511 length:447 start_codon:yes stop_codon:yes gene_type:complete